MVTDRTCLNTKKLMCEPTRRHGIFVPPPQQQQKARCFIQGFYKGYGSNTHERQYVIEVRVLSERQETDRHGNAESEQDYGDNG